MPAATVSRRLALSAIVVLACTSACRDAGDDAPTGSSSAPAAAPTETATVDAGGEEAGADAHIAPGSGGGVVMAVGLGGPAGGPGSAGGPGGDAGEPAGEAEEPPAEADDPLAELPHWPVGLHLPEALTVDWKRRKKWLASAKAHVLAWAPPGTEHIRAVLLIPNNSDSKHVGEHAALRAVAERRGIGIVYLRWFAGAVVERSDPPERAEATFAAVLDLVAERTGIAEFRHAPWITFGKSSRGRFPFRTTWRFPGRVVASISYHGETPSWPMAEWSRVGDESVLHLAINGQREWEGTWYRHVRPCLLNYHANTGWLTHQVILPGVGHGDYVDVHGGPGWGEPVPEGEMSCLRVWDYIALFVDKAMALRVPAEGYPTEGPTALLPVDRAGGWLIHPRAPEELLGTRWFAFRRRDGAYRIVPWPEEKSPVYDPDPGTVAREELIRPATAVPEAERAARFWVADREQALAWLRLHGVADPDPELLPPAAP